jgi:NAD(P)H dehydrogenase (quinone)
MRIGVTGATGQLGRLAVAALVRRAPAAEVVALARDPARAADLGVAVRRADYRDAASLAEAVAGLDVVALISSNDFDDRAGQHRAVIEAAAAAGVGRIVYTSILKGEASPLMLAADHVATEAAIRGSGLAHTILRNGWYTENYTAWLPGAVQAGGLIGAAGEGRLSTATRADYAEALAVAAADESPGNRVHELAGDTGWTMAGLAEEVSHITGRQIGYTDMTPEAYAAALTGFGLPEAVARAIADADGHARTGALFDDSGTLSALIGRPTTPLAAAVAAALR